MIAVADIQDNDPAWQKGLPRSANGGLKTTYAVCVAILRNDPSFVGFSFNSRMLNAEWRGRAIDEGFLLGFAEKIELKFGVTPGFDLFVRAVLCVSRENTHDPVRDELDRLSWDGERRLATLCHRALGNAGVLESVLLRKTIIAAVVRAFEPGSQVDSICVLTGLQGAKKSGFWRTLAGKHFGDSVIDFSSKDAPMQMRAAWIYELPEIDGITTRRHADQVKAFVTIRTDQFRPPYARAVERHDRATVFVGSTNREDYLADSTGSRRFWTIDTGRTSINVRALAADRDQLLAEAVDDYREWVAQGRPPESCLWWLTADEENTLRGQALRFQETDPWEPILIEWLARQFAPRDVTEIILGALQIEKGKITRADQIRVGKIMHALGYSIERPRENGARRRVYVRVSECAVDTANADSTDSQAVAHDTVTRSNWSGLVQADQENDLASEFTAWSNRSNTIFPAHTHTRADACVHPRKPIGPIGPIGPDREFPHKNGPIESAISLDQSDHEPFSFDYNLEARETDGRNGF